ncbi:MAG: TetR/AcrR family transcriptional regulator [Gammaproteobacteria bacterium]|nr:TetR/AcrR family transcriptional regulator [Gammaproteobacteria bacterium]MBU2059864.1 TetR/AcrR family transcriptional regulator [Gammaproteobacteria bacterium]MBU2175355.1 TetR/AcrR family transcriptional regulator [Gammaproteobacteria bacterium]MBU2245737.1 TetR/AcrR family transcriptional regulator [Gammaproteobacteria bacterium]MBU2345141.1 TetR/AcrR family transcriptional regulator [Gammaproteobacteria bacterium]
MEPDKKQQLVETALKLFYRHGVHAVGINQILEQSAIAKKTLYHHFISKDELLMATLELRHQRFYQWLELQLASADPISPVEKLFDALTLWFESKAEVLGPFFGCYFQNCAAEYHGPESAVLQLCAQHKLKVKHLVNTHLQSYQLSEEAQSLLLNGLMLLKEGAISMALLHMDATVAQHAKKQALLLLQALS